MVILWTNPPKKREYFFYYVKETVILDIITQHNAE